MLCDVLKRRDLDMMTITEQELGDIFNQFKQQVAQKAEKAKIKQQATTQTQC